MAKALPRSASGMPFYQTKRLVARVLEDKVLANAKCVTAAERTAFAPFFRDWMTQQVILPTASGVSNEGGSSPLLVPLPAVSWPWVPAWGSLEPARRAGENAQKTRKNGGKMGEIWTKRCGDTGEAAARAGLRRHVAALHPAPQLLHCGRGAKPFAPSSFLCTREQVNTHVGEHTLGHDSISLAIFS